MNNTKEFATQAAEALLKQMDGAGWRVRVWRNLDWYYSVEHLDGHISVRPSRQEGKFHCVFSDGTYANTGCTDWSTYRVFDNPNKAVQHTLKLARKHVNKLEAWISRAEKKLL